MSSESLKALGRRAIPPRGRRRIRRMLARPPVGSLRLGSLRRTDPISRDYGFDRGQPVDRHYIDRFLARHDRDIRGRVLEIGDDDYTRRFGGWTGAPSSVSRVEAVDVLDAAADNPGATIVADLADAPHVADATYDCVVCTQTLLLIYDVRAAIATTHRILRPGGVVLATVPGTSRICRPEAERFGDWWRFTSMSAGRLFEEAFGPDAVSVSSYGNVLAATAMLHGIAAEELRPEELDAHDPDFEVLIGVRAVRR